MNDVPGVVASLGFPEGTAFVDAADANVVVLVATERVELEQLMPATVERLAPGAQLWVLFRKGGKAAGIDVGRDSVWGIADGLGMRPPPVERRRGLVCLPPAQGLRARSEAQAKRKEATRRWPPFIAAEQRRTLM